MGRKSTENPCPQDVLVRELANKLDVTMDVAKYIYDVYTVACVELLQDYDCVKVLPFVFLERKMSTPKKMYNVQTGEICMTEPKDTLKARVTAGCKEYEDTSKYIERHEERMEKRALYEAQVEQEREEAKRLREEEKRRQRKKNARKTKAKRKREKIKRRAMEMLAEDEMRLHQEEQRRYHRDLERRRKG